MGDETPHKHSAQEFLDALQLTGRLLAERDQQFEVVVIGGANLAILNIVDRLTVDVDVVALRVGGSLEFICANPLPEDLEAVVADVARIKRLPTRWMNGTASTDFELGLPPGYDTRLRTRVFGGLTVSFADRADVVAWKLQAAVDNLGMPNRHLDDLRRMRPTLPEVDAARNWFVTVEGPDSGFWKNLEATIGELEKND